MLNTASAVNAPTIPAEYSTEQRTVAQTLMLHLLPGVVITIAFILLGPWLKANHLPPMLAILLPILFVLIPMELSFLFYLGYRRNGRLSLEGIVLYRERLPIKDYLILLPALVIWFLITFVALANLDQAILKTYFSWLPEWFDLARFTSADYSQPVLTVTFLLTIVLNGIVGPAVEELYFRGYLLPRIEYMKGWAPLVNAVLFSLYHFFNPWMNITRIIALIPMAYTVRWKKSIYLSMLAHCLLNTVSTLLTASVFLH